MEGHRRIGALSGVHLLGAAAPPLQTAHGCPGPAPAPLRRPPDRDQFERAPAARARRAFAALFLSAKSYRLYRRQAAVSGQSMTTPKRKSTKPAAPRKKAPAKAKAKSAPPSA